MKKEYFFIPKIKILGCVLGCTFFLGCANTDDIQTLPYPTLSETTTEVSLETETDLETETPGEENSTEISTEIETIEVAPPFITEPETETPESETEEPTPQETRFSNAMSKRIENGIYDFAVEYKDEEQNYRVRFVIPQIYTRNKKLFQSRNDALVTYAQANFNTVYVLRDLDIEYIYDIKTEDNELLSYLYTGYITHLDTNNGQFREKDYSLHAFTMERKTGKAYNIEEYYGMDRVVKEISEGNYEVVSGKKSVFESFRNEDLATLYRDYPAVAKDPEHFQDFYVENGKVVVIIWVGNTYGNYVTLRLNPDPVEDMSGTGV